jgi:hypothetical protein
MEDTKFDVHGHGFEVATIAGNAKYYRRMLDHTMAKEQQEKFKQGACAIVDALCNDIPRIRFIDQEASNTHALVEVVIGGWGRDHPNAPKVLALVPFYLGPEQLGGYTKIRTRFQVENSDLTCFNIDYESVLGEETDLFMRFRVAGEGSEALGNPQLLVKSIYRCIQEAQVALHVNVEEEKIEEENNAV